MSKNTVILIEQFNLFSSMCHDIEDIHIFFCRFPESRIDMSKFCFGTLKACKFIRESKVMISPSNANESLEINKETILTL